jgi:hypothetical protein
MQSDRTFPSWLRFVMASDRAGSAWFVGLGFFFAPALAMASPWPTLTTALWLLIAAAGLWLGLLGVAMAVGLAIVLRSGAELPDDYWQSILGWASAPTSLRDSSSRSRGARVVDLPMLDAVEPARTQALRLGQ